MPCEICGSPTEHLFSVLIEGATLRVCGSCAKLGSPVRERKVIKVAVQRPKSSSSSLEEPSMELVQEYHKVIKQARERLGLSQEQLGRKINEKSSVIRLMESGKLKPNDLLVRKMEHALKIRLLAPVETE
jgi:putative transcription factor